MNGTVKLVKGQAVYEGTAGFSGADTLLISEGRVKKIGKWESLRSEFPEIPAEELKGLWLCPSLINTHVHLEFDGTAEARKHWMDETSEIRFLRAATRAQKLLKSGVTVARDAGSSWGLMQLKEAHELPLPLLQLAGVPITVTGGHLHFLGEETDGAEKMIRAVRLRSKLGCDAVKLIVTGGQMTPGSLPERVSMMTDEIWKMTEEAHALGLPTFAHCLTTEGFIRSMEGGVDCIEHVACFVRCVKNGLLERIWDEERMNRCRETNRFFMMGLSQGYHSLDGYREGKIACTPREEFLLQQEERMFDIFRKCTALGLRPVCGTDAGTGWTNFDETWMELNLMHERGGLSASEAIHVCTAQSAECLNLGGLRGILKPGSFADFVALKNNPLINLSSYAVPACVYFEGKRVSASLTC